MQSAEQSLLTDEMSNKVSPSTVLQFAAPIEGGKTTLSKAVAERLGAPRVSFGAWLRSHAQEKQLKLTREVLQDLGEQLVQADVGSFCLNVLAQESWSSGQPLVIDGVRHQQVLSTLDDLLAPSEGYLIYVSVDPVTQSKRLETDDLPHEKSLAELEQHSTEVQVKPVLLEQADLVLNGTLDVEVLVEQVLNFLKRPHPGKRLKNWEDKNTRRIELAKKKNREGLNDAELSEFDQIQTGYFEYLNAKHPREPQDLSRLAEIESRLQAEEGTSEIN